MNEHRYRQDRASEGAFDARIDDWRPEMGNPGAFRSTPWPDAQDRSSDYARDRYEDEAANQSEGPYRRSWVGRPRAEWDQSAQSWSERYGRPDFGDDQGRRAAERYRSRDGGYDDPYAGNRSYAEDRSSDWSMRESREYGRHATDLGGRSLQAGGRRHPDDFGSFRERNDHDRPSQYERPYQGSERSARNRQGPKGYQRSDERIREDVCDQMMYSYDLDPSNIEVTVKDGEVTLRGDVASRAEKRLAERLAEAVLGVKDVIAEVRVRTKDAERQDSTSTAASDTGSSSTREESSSTSKSTK